MQAKIRTDSFIVKGQSTLEYVVHNDKTATDLMKFEDPSSSDAVTADQIARGLILTMSLPQNDILFPYVVLAWMEDFLMDYTSLTDVLGENNYGYKDFIANTVIPAISELGIELPYPIAIIEQYTRTALGILLKRYPDTEIFDLLELAEITPVKLYRMYVISTTVLTYKSDGILNKIHTHCMFPEDYDKQLKQEMSGLRAKPSFHTFDENNDMRSVIKTRTLFPQLSTRAAIIRMCIKCSILQQISNSNK